MVHAKYISDFLVNSVVILNMCLTQGCNWKGSCQSIFNQIRHKLFSSTFNGILEYIVLYACICIHIYVRE